MEDISYSQTHSSCPQLLSFEEGGSENVTEGVASYPRPPPMPSFYLIAVEIFLHSCEIKPGCGRPGYKVMRVYLCGCVVANLI